MSIQGNTSPLGGANSLGLNSGQALQGQKARGRQASLGHGSFNGQKPGGLPLNVSSALGIMIPKCFVQVRPSVANFHPGAARVLRAPQKKSQLGRLSFPGL